MDNSRVGILVLATLGCAPVQLAKTPMEMGIGPEAKVTLAPGDPLDIKFFHVSELNESQAVRPDGKIALQLVGEVTAQGKTPTELRHELTKLYTPQLKKPEVALIVRSLANRPIYVGGDVNRPGFIDMFVRLTVLEAIVQAEGFDTRKAEASNVLITRHKDGEGYGWALDFRDALLGKEFKSFHLEPLDIVYVPRDRIYQVANWIDQHINQMIPRIGFSWTKDVDSGKTAGITAPPTIVTQP